MAADDLRLKVSITEYQQRIGILDSKINEMETLLREYEDLKRGADKVLGESDSNAEKLKNSVQANINAVKGQQNILKESRAMLQKQMEDLGISSQDITNLLSEADAAAKTAFNTIKAVGNMVE